jgi:hypothetical protein
VPLFRTELTTVLTTTMTTVGLPDASTYTTIELVSCLVEPSACAYGSEGLEFGSLRGRPTVGINRPVSGSRPERLPHRTSGTGTSTER